MVFADGRGRGGGGEGEGGGEEGLELVLPQRDGKPACQRIVQTGLALHLENLVKNVKNFKSYLGLSLAEASDGVKEVTFWTPEWPLCR